MSAGTVASVQPINAPRALAMRRHMSGTNSKRRTGRLPSRIADLHAKKRALAHERSASRACGSPHSRLVAGPWRMRPVLDDLVLAAARDVVAAEVAGVGDAAVEDHQLDQLVGLAWLAAVAERDAQLVDLDLALLGDLGQLVAHLLAPALLVLGDDRRDPGEHREPEGGDDRGDHEALAAAARERCGDEPGGAGVDRVPVGAGDGELELGDRALRVVEGDAIDRLAAGDRLGGVRPQL